MIYIAGLRARHSTNPGPRVAWPDSSHVLLLLTSGPREEIYESAAVAVTDEINETKTRNVVSSITSFTSPGDKQTKLTLTTPKWKKNCIGKDTEKLLLTESHFPAEAKVGP